ncbi:MAG: hypothetical protein ACE1ZZ_00965 [Dehalococcoidia bacterium]
MATLTIQAAAQSLGTSEITVRRKLRTGQLSGHQEDPPNGRWWVEIPDEQLIGADSAASGSLPEGQEGHLLRDLVGVLKDQVTTLQHHLEIREREVGELHVIIQQQALALPAPGGSSRGWWRKIWPGSN